MEKDHPSNLLFVYVCMQVHPFHIQIAIGHHDFSKSRCLYLFKSPSFTSMFGAKMCSTCHGPAIPSRPGPAPMASLRPPPSALGPRRPGRRGRRAAAAPGDDGGADADGGDVLRGAGRSDGKQTARTRRWEGGGHS